MAVLERIISTDLGTQSVGEDVLYDDTEYQTRLDSIAAAHKAAYTRLPFLFAG